MADAGKKLRESRKRHKEEEGPLIESMREASLQIVRVMNPGSTADGRTLDPVDVELKEITKKNAITVKRFKEGLKNYEGQIINDENISKIITSLNEKEETTVTSTLKISKIKASKNLS
tara:strand:+ start:1917 stop:2270 length:354 start_codon:yes stop_codon:yes gene_type:complete